MSEEAKEENKEAAEAATPRKKFSGKKLVLFIILPLILIVGAGLALFLGGFIGKKEEAKEDAHAQEEVSLEHAVFFEMPEMLINLAGTGKKPNYLKLKVSLALDSADDQHHVETLLPLIVDQYQVYLRGLRVDDLQGSAGLQRLREELLMRAGLVTKPIKVRDVLFNQMLVQ